MRILIDGRNLGSSTGRYTENLLKHLAAIDTEGEYIVLTKKTAKWVPPAKNFKKLSARANEYTWAEQTKLLKQIKSLRADLIHFTMPQHPVFYRRPFVITIHDLTLLDFINRGGGNPIARIVREIIKPLAFRLVMRHGVKKSKAIIVPSDLVKSQILNRYKVDAHKITVTPEAPTKLAVTPESIKRLSKKRFLLYVGNAYPYKNLERLLYAFKIVHATQPDLWLALIGKPEYYYHQLQEFVRNKNIPNVAFCGYVADAQLGWAYEKAVAYVFPSLSEGFGLPGLEAMYYGLPVIASNAGPLPEVYGQAAAYFNPASTEDVAEVILATISSPAALHQMRRAGLIQAKQFSWAKMAKQTLEVYRSVIR